MWTETQADSDEPTERQTDKRTKISMADGTNQFHHQLCSDAKIKIDRERDRQATSQAGKHEEDGLQVQTKIDQTLEMECPLVTKPGNIGNPPLTD